MEERPVILVVDDSKTNRAILKSIFQQDYRILEAVNGQVGMKVLEENSSIALILLDINMPIMDGFQFLKLMQDSAKYSAIPVVIDTELGDEESEIKALRLGAMDFISKPYNPEIVLHRVQNVMAKLQMEHSRTAQKMQERQIKELRYHVERDLLTGIYNRGTFCKKTEVLLQENPEQEYWIIQWDIERFKVINDLFGTNVGDKVLIGIATTLDSLLRGIGTYGRMNADHFVCCVPKEFLKVNTIIGKFDEAFEKLELHYNIVIYAGLYLIRDITLPIDQMCDRAALALRTVKGNYMKRYAIYDKELRDAMLEEQNIVGEMQAALDEGQFCIYLQPIYSITEERLVSAEALVRWKHPTRGMIMPAVFIPLFERNGFITKMDYYVWKETCQYLRERKRTGKKEIPISVNISRINLYNPGFCDIISQLAAEEGLDPSVLKLEITESAYMDNPRQLLATMGQLQERGFKILTDDFGSGYSSLNMLKDVPSDVLKIDMKFIDDFENSTRAGSIINSVVHMAKALNMSVVAEGVETKVQYEFLRSIACDNVQGYYFSKPLPIEEFERLVDVQ